VAWAGSLTVSEWDTGLNSKTYGQPKMWQYAERLPNGSSRRVNIHPDRVFILGDYSDDAIGFLEPAYNAFVSLEKVEGGSGESFLKNAARQLNVNFEKEIDFNNLASLYGVSIDELQDKFNDVAGEMNRGNDVLMTTQGATVTPLVTAVADPSATYKRKPARPPPLELISRRASWLVTSRLSAPAPKTRNTLMLVVSRVA